MRLIRHFNSVAVLVLANLVVATHGAEVTTIPDGYSIHQNVPLHGASSKVRGSLQVLEDARLTPDLRETMWAGLNDPLASLEGLGYAKDDPLYDSFNRDPIKAVRIRLSDRAGHSLDEREFDWPLGQVEDETVNLGDRVAYLVTINSSNGSGAYTGDTYVGLISDGKLRWQSVIDDKTAKGKELVLTRSLKEDWRIADDAAGHQTILAVGSHPNRPATEDLVVDYNRIVFRDGEWHRITRSEIGFWDSEHDFPDQSKFPPWPRRARRSQ